MAAWPYQISDCWPPSSGHVCTWASVRCFVNAEKRQDSNTSQLIYNIWQLIAYLSTPFTLQPGDLLATGTPQGVGIGMKPPTFLKSGDIVRCEIDQIGAIESKIVPPFRHPATPGSPSSRKV